MTELTQDQRDALERAKVRSLRGDRKPQYVDDVDDVLSDALNLQSLALAQATLIDDLVTEAHHRQSQLDDERNENGVFRERLEQQAARIALLEDELRLQAGGLDMWTVE